MNGIDMARFDFDYDNTWQSFFLDADLNVYARYGGRDASSPESRLNKESLLQTMREVLAAHEQAKAISRNKDHTKSGTDRTVKPDEATAQASRTALFHPVPSSEKRTSDIPLIKQNHSGCLHCHQVQEYRLLQSVADGVFDSNLLFPFPLPENIGLAFDREHGHRVVEITPESAAEKAGLLVGDVIVRCEATPIHSEDDFRWTLHRQRGDATLTIWVERFEPNSSNQGHESESETPQSAPPKTKVQQPGEIRKLSLELRGGWRTGDVSWRKSLRSYPIPWGFLAYPIGSEERKALGISDDSMAIKVVSIRGQVGGVAKAVGLQKGDWIIALDGKTKYRTLEQFKSDMIGRYRPGDQIELVIRRGEEILTLKGLFPDWYNSDRSVP